MLTAELCLQEFGELMGARRVIHLHGTRKVIEDVGKQQNSVIEMISTFYS